MEPVQHEDGAGYGIYVALLNRPIPGRPHVVDLRGYISHRLSLAAAIYGFRARSKEVDEVLAVAVAGVLRPLGGLPELLRRVLAQQLMHAIFPVRLIAQQ